MKLVKLLGGSATCLYSQERGVDDVLFRTDHRLNESLVRLLSISYSLQSGQDSNLYSTQTRCWYCYFQRLPIPPPDCCNFSNPQSYQLCRPTIRRIQCALLRGRFYISIPCTSGYCSQNRIRTCDNLHQHIDKAEIPLYFWQKVFTSMFRCVFQLAT